MSAANRPLKLDDFSLGMNNRAPDFRLEVAEGDQVRSFLRSVVNADLTAEGSVRRRRGYQRVVSGTACHSFWSDGTVGYFADGASLIRLDPNLGDTTVHSDLIAGAPVSFAKVGTDVYYSDGARLRRLDADGVDHPAGVPRLVSEPILTALPGDGSVPAGRYQLCVTLVNADGEESGSSTPQQVELTEAGAIGVSGLPSSFPEGVTALRVYMTATNGSTLQRVLTLASAVATIEIPVLMDLGARCPTLLLAPMPAGRIVRHCLGRLLVASAGLLFYSEPFAPALMHPLRGWIKFPDPVVMVEPCVNGFFIATTKQTYWVAGDVAQAELQAVLAYGAVLGASGQLPDETACWWMSTAGIVRGRPDGSVQNLQEKAVAVAPAALGAALYREQDGMKQAVASLFGSDQSTLVARTWMEAEVIRKETVL